MDIEVEVVPDVNIKEIEFSNESNDNIPTNNSDKVQDKLLPDNIIISIQELVHPHFGCYLWPGSYVLASYIWYYKYEFINKTTLELGSGVSLPSLLLAKLKYEYFKNRNKKFTPINELPPTIITDISKPRFILTNIQKEVILNDMKLNENSSVNDKIENEIDINDNCNSNNDIQYNIFVEPLYWGVLDTLESIIQKINNINVATIPPNNNSYTIDYILAADNFFIPKDYEDILATISFIFRNYPKAKFITTYQERSSQRTIQHLLDEWNMKASLIPLSTFNCNVNDLVIREENEEEETTSKTEIDNNLNFGGSIYSIFLLIIELKQ
ncbi:hypothetical protein H8356DRAFT_1744295 [Neocallimastix lanati (nom. inval.)]|jgi:hypothetical protein|nr:hypothetical protein H8356DRAFT_1744295 [Neocallimastix sp. JGI-2020a]